MSIAVDKNIAYPTEMNEYLSINTRFSTNQEILPNKCRICLGFDQKNMISPCKCSGSAKFVHEYCLKEWVKIRYLFDPEVFCEVCKAPLAVEIEKANKFNPSKGAEENYVYCCMIPVLIVIVIILSAILALTWLYKIDFKDNTIDSIIVLITVLFPLIISVALIPFFCYKVFFVSEIRFLKIHSNEEEV